MIDEALLAAYRSTDFIVFDRDGEWALNVGVASPRVDAIPGARNAAEVASHWQWARLNIPAALWEDLRGRGLLHPEAPVPQGPVL